MTFHNFHNVITMLANNLRERKREKEIKIEYD